MCYSGVTCVTPELHAQLSPKMSREKQSLAGLHTSCDNNNNIIITLVLI